MTIPSSRSLIFEVKSTGSGARVYTRPKTGTGKCEGCFRRSSQADVFGRLRTSSGIFGNDRVVFKNYSTPRIKISRLCFKIKKQLFMIYNSGEGSVTKIKQTLRADYLNEVWTTFMKVIV